MGGRPPYSNRGGRPKGPRALRGGSWCTHQGRMSYDRGVVEVGLATKATTGVEIVIYDITTLG